MIVSRRDGELVVIAQTDHAHFAAELLSLWCAGGLPDHPRREELLLAAREHDNGWRESDSAPSCDRESGRPHDFLSLPDPQRREIWRRGTRRLVEREPYAALLIVRHAERIHQRQRDDPAWEPVIAEWRELADELVATTGAADGDQRRDDRWLELADLLSLTACQGWAMRVERHGMKARLDGDVLRLDPFPLAGATSFTLRGRRIPDRRYDGDADLGGELAAARWRELALHVVPQLE